MLRTGNRKSKQAKAHEITKETKQIVWERQHGKSLFAPYKPITVEMCCCHFIPRARGGLGTEWNIFGCFQAPWADEHKAFDHQLSDKEVRKITNLTPDEMVTVVRNHLMENYDGWCEDNCRYKKGYELEDYEIRRKK